MEPLRCVVNYRAVLFYSKTLFLNKCSPQSKTCHHLKLYKHWVTDVTGYVGPKFIPLVSMYVQWIKETIIIKEKSVNLYFVKQRENKRSISSPIDAFGHLVGYHRKSLN